MPSTPTTPSTAGPPAPTPPDGADRLTAALDAALHDLEHLAASLRRGLSDRLPTFAVARALIAVATFHRQLSDLADLLLLPPSERKLPDATP